MYLNFLNKITNNQQVCTAWCTTLLQHNQQVATKTPHNKMMPLNVRDSARIERFDNRSCDLL